MIGSEQLREILSAVGDLLEEKEEAVRIVIVYQLRMIIMHFGR